MNWKDIFPKENRYFETDNGILYNGDCLEILTQFPNDAIDLIVTSPPYNVGINYTSWNDKMDIKDYFDFVFCFLKQVYVVLKKDGRFAINVPYEVNMKHTGKSNRMLLVGEYYSLIKKAGLHYNSIIDLVEKQPQRIKFTAWGSWLSSSSPYCYNPKECVIVGYKEQWKKINKGKSTMSKDLFKEIVSGMWKYHAETKGLTLANFSEDIPYKAINGFSYESNIVLDPFMGSGTTAIVAEKLNRKWIGVEISPKYCEIIKNRIIGE